MPTVRPQQPVDVYARHSPLTDPGAHAGLLEALPDDLSALHAVLDGILVHVWKVKRDAPQRLEDGHDVYTRHVERLLGHVLALDDRPLGEARPVARRAITDCRHFAVLLAAILRQRGRPARARCGFATYLEPTHANDHWICEVWDGAAGRWRQEDADVRRHDLPPGAFITGCAAWRRCRADPGQAGRFGFEATQRGMWPVRVNLVRDFAALNGFESVSGDAWGLAALPATGAPTGADLALLDRAAAAGLSADSAAALAARRSLYAASAGLCAPDVLEHFDYLATGTLRPVAWRQAP
jgi:hypothetical protein